MDKKEALKDRKSFLVLILLCVVLFMPFFARASLLTTKDNDLGRTYIPIITFLKNSFWQNLSIPLWRGDQLGGEPFIANPVFTPTYPGNIVFLIFPIGFAVVFYHFLHFSLSLISTFYLSRSFSISKYSSFAAAIFYTFSAKILLHLSAGHLTMVAAFCYLPLVFLSTRKVLTSPKFIWILTLACSLSFMLALYATVFYYTLFFLLAYATYFFTKNSNVKNDFALNTKTVVYLAAALLLCLCLSAIFLLPQIEFGPLSTRAQLSINDVALPLWNIKRFALSLLAPYLIFKDIDHESFLYLGLVPMVLSFLSFFYLPKTKKIILTIFVILTLLFISGLSTPFFKFLYDYLPFLSYSRITTRLWFIIAIITTLLSAFALDRIKNKNVTFIAIAFFLAEIVFIGYFKILSVPNLKFDNVALYEYLASDKEVFRVYCTTYCFNPQLLAKYKVQILNGESPIQSEAQVDFLQKAGNYSYNNFAVIFPPYEVWQTNDPPKPNSELLGFANVKYIASTYELNDKNFIPVGTYENIFLYRNNNFLTRAYFEDSHEPTTITNYSENSTTITYPKADLQRSIIFSELYYPGWNAYSNGEKIVVEKLDTASRKVTIPSDSNKTELKFEPKSFVIGKSITFSTILFLAITFWFNKSKHQYG